MLAAEPSRSSAGARRALPGTQRPRSRSYETLPRPSPDVLAMAASTRKGVASDRRGLLKSLDDNPPHHAISRTRHLFSRTTSAAPELHSPIYLLPNETMIKIFGYGPPLYDSAAPLTASARFLGTEDLARVGRVCYLWTALTRGHWLWTALLEREMQCVAAAHPPTELDEAAVEADEPLYLEPAEVKFASVRQLVEMLTAETHGDPIFMKTFLTTYQTFISPQRLMLSLLRRYDLHHHTQLSTHGRSSDDGRGHLPMLPIQIRVCNVLRNWVDEFYSDFDRGMRSLLALFVRARLVREGHHEVARILRHSVAVARQTQPDESRPGPRSYAHAPPPRIAPKMLVSAEQWLEWDEEEVARQLTLRDWEQFSAVTHTELLLRPALGHGLKVAAMVGTFNRTCVGVAHLVLMQRDRKERAKAVCKWIRIAEYLRTLNNFHSLVAVLSALGSNAISRLRHTFAKVPRSSVRVLEELQEAMTTNENYRRYRALLAQTPGPAIPFVGLPLRDLAMIEDCNLSVRGLLVNFSKRRLLYNVISQFRLLQQTPYHFVPLPAVVRLLDAQFVLVEENELWSLSEALEPTKVERR